MGVNYMALAKEARDNKDFYLEKKYLEEAYELNPNNTKIVNALIRNSKKINHPYELEKWLEVLYNLKPSGEVLFQLIQIARNDGNKEREEELLMKKRDLEPNNRKVNKTLSNNETNKKRNVVRNPLPYVELSEEEYLLVKEIRNVIYGEDDFKVKVEKIRQAFEMRDEIVFCLLVELYKHELFKDFAIKMIKEYKKSLDEDKPSNKLRLANKMLQVTLNKKNFMGDWDLFWLHCKKDTLILVKK